MSLGNNICMAATDNKVLLYAHPSMEALAESIVECCMENDWTASQEKRVVNKIILTLVKPRSARNFTFGTDNKTKNTIPEKYERGVSFTTQRFVEFRKTIKWDTFADGFPNLFIEDVKYMAGHDVIFIGSFHSPQVIFEQISLLFSFPRYLARSFCFILPYFPTGTMERVETEGQIATAKTLATILSSIPLTSRGPAQIIIFDIHALQERFYFSESVIPRLETAIPLLIRETVKLPEKDKLSFAFPDDGAFKRFHTYFPEDNLIICSKVREGKKRIVKVKDGMPIGRHVVIVDDLVQTGGTLKECAKALIEMGALTVSAYVTHAVFPKESWKRFVDSDVQFENFWITDSVPHAKEICQHKPFKLLSLSTIIAETLLGFDLLQT